jgi:hypothetical protein
MMVERVPFEVAEAAAAALGVPLPPVARQLADSAERFALSLIAGWDVRESGADHACIKLYLNASDASVTVRRAAGERLGLGTFTDPVLDAPAVIGLNAARDGTVEIKAYVQREDAVELARPLGAAARSLASRATAEGAVACGVASWDVSATGATPRAFFVALRDPSSARRDAWNCLQSLPRWDDNAMRATVPFATGAARSIGVSVNSDDAWTVYFKPRSCGRAPHVLEPAGVFRTSSVEVGLFVEPNESAQRAYVRTARHALSVRLREGPEPLRADLASLMQWAAVAVRAAERDGMPAAERIATTAPPTPWKRT